jgi:hypothetical protein
MHLPTIIQIVSLKRSIVASYIIHVKSGLQIKLKDVIKGVDIQEKHLILRILQSVDIV